MSGVALAACAAFIVTTMPALADACEAPVAAAATQVASVDAYGDIRLTDGSLLRLAGIAWPPSSQPEARAKLARIVMDITRDAGVQIIGRGSLDRWGRQPAQVFSGREWVQGRLVEDGHALAWPEAAGRECWPALLERDMLARDGRLGVWSALGRRPRTEARRLRHEGFARRLVFEGVVRSVRPGRSVTFVNFVGPRGRTPSWFVSRRLSADFSRSGREVATFQGKRLRLRAEFSATPTPRLVVATPEGVELLD